MDNLDASPDSVAPLASASAFTAASAAAAAAILASGQAALASALTDLAAALDGAVLTPDAPDWDRVRLAWDLAVDQHPAAIVVARSESDVARTLRVASSLGIRVAPQSTGHGAAAVGDLAGAILLRTGALDSVVIDAAARTATVGAGAMWSAVMAQAAPLGLAGLSGSSSTVGIVGFCMGGGLGWLSREHGLGCGSILAARVALPDGTVVTASPVEHADLWWALRGGGGVGVVTELTIRLVEIAALVAGTLWWPVSRTREVLRVWAGLLPDLPTNVTTVGRVLRFPEAPEVPDPLRGESFVLVQAAVLGTVEDADRALAPLRELAPAMDDVAVATPDILGELAMDPPEPSAGISEGLVLATLDSAAVDAWVDALESPACASVMLAEIRHLEGALTPTDPEAAALPGIDGVASALAFTPITPAQDAALAQASVDDALAALAPWSATHQYANFVEQPVAQRTLWGAAVDRLAEVRRTYDPDALVMRRHGTPR